MTDLASISKKENDMGVREKGNTDYEKGYRRVQSRV